MLKKVFYGETYNPKHYPNIKINFTKREMIDVSNHYHKFFSLRLTAKHFYTTVIIVRCIIDIYDETKGTFSDYFYVTECLGHKKDPYYSEEELLLGIPNYNWEELSKLEKQFYLDYEKRNRITFRFTKHDRKNISLE